MIQISSSNNRLSSPVTESSSPKSLTEEKLFFLTSSMSSDLIFESEIILNRTIRSFGLFFCSALFIANGLRVLIFLLAQFDPTIIQNSVSVCRLESFILHVFSLFHLNLTIIIRVFWHFCFLVDQYWQRIRRKHIFTFIICLVILLSLFTSPSLTNEWASIKFDSVLNLCVVNYSFRWSYTFFLLSFTCFIPYVFLIISHQRQIKSIEQRFEKHFSSFILDKNQELCYFRTRKNHFICISYIILIWALINIILLVGIHTPLQDESVRFFFYYSQLFALLLDPILYIFIFRSLSIITLLRPTSELQI